MFLNRDVRRITSVITSVMLVLMLLLPVGVTGPTPLVWSAAAQAYEPPQAILTADEPLNGSIDNARLHIQLLGDTFVDSELDEFSFILLNGPQGLTVTEAVYSSSSVAEVFVSFDGSIEQDYPYFQIMIVGSELSSGVSLTTNTLMISRYDRVFFVNSFSDGIDIDVGDGVCDAGGGACTLRAAIMEANATSSADKIILPEGLYILDIPSIDGDDASTADLDILYPLVIEGAGQDETTIDGGGLDRVFDIYSELVLTDVTITGGYSHDGYGGAVLNEGQLTMERVTIRDNATDGFGGGLYNAGSASLYDVTIIHNEAGTSGGAIYNDNGYLDVYSSHIQANATLSEDGATIVVTDMDDQSYVILQHNKILDNDASYVISNDSQTAVSAQYNYWGEDGPGHMLGHVTALPYFLSEDMSDEFMSGDSSDLKDLIVSGGILSPEISRFNDDYTVHVGSDSQSITLTPVLYDPRATVKIDEVEIDPQQPYEIQLNEQGQHVIFIEVTDPEGWLTRTYTVTIQRMQTFIVNTTVDSVEGCTGQSNNCSLRAAIIQANMTAAHDTIILGPGVYKLQSVLEENQQAPDAEWGDLDISNPLTIIGAGSSETIIDATDIADRIFDIQTTAFHLSGVTLTGGVSDVAVIHFEGDDYSDSTYSMTDVVIAENDASYQASVISLLFGELTLEDVVIRDNISYMGTIYVGYDARVIAQQTVFENNVAIGNGGGIYNWGELELTDVIFRGNESRLGGAIFNNGWMKVEDSIFENNKAVPVIYIDSVASGGAIFNDGEATIIDSSFIGNVVGGEQPQEFGIYLGGAIYNDSYGQMEISSTTISNNLTLDSEEEDYMIDSAGGGIYNEGRLSIDKSKIHGNRSKLGGGIHSSGYLLLENSEISNNEGDIGGGLFTSFLCHSCFEDYSDVAPNMIINSTFHGNEAKAMGGGAFMFNVGIISNSTFSGNKAGMLGGGIYGVFALMISHSTIVDNRLTGELFPEGIEEDDLWTPAGSGLYIDSQTFTEPEPIEGSETIEEIGEGMRTVFVANSIIYGDDEFTVCEGPITLLGTNIVRDGCGPKSTHQTLIMDQEPLLGPLAHNGGYVPTHALLSGSPALDAANEIRIDDLVSDVLLDDELLGPHVEELLQVFNPSTDARMIARSQGQARDIGAYEVEWVPYVILPYYDAIKEQLVIRFGSELGLIADPELAPLLADHFTVSVGDNREQRVVSVEHVSYGDDGQTVILELDEEIWPSDTIMITVEPNAVRFTSDTHVHWMQGLNVLTAWQVTAYLLERAGEIEVTMLDIGMIVRALGDGSLEQLLEEYQHEFVQDPTLIRLLLSLIQVQYIERRSTPV